MKLKLANLDGVIQKLRSFLPQYLIEFDIDIENNFSCLNPKHEDEKPSMSCSQNPENAYCFTCGVTCDIFQAAHWLEEKPLSGPGFIEENVRYLAEKFGVELELEEMTEDELYRYRTYRAYAAAADIVTNPEFGSQTKLKKEIKKRGWHPSLAKVGTVEYKEFRDTLKAMGFEARFQDEIDLGRPSIFNEESMIFTIRDEWGRPVGFAARNLAYDGKNGAKYMNQKTTGLRCNIYQKGRRLYEVHTAVKYTPPLYIFEGYTDVLTAQNAGLFNCAAIGGTAFTQQHVELLKQLGIYNIILVLDGDKAGRERMVDLLDNYFCGHRDLQIDLINLPDEMDPDDFIREKGLEEFLNLQKWGAFQWRLNRYSDDDDPEEICKIMIPLIVNEPSRITQDKMCGELALFTGIDKKVISSELERLQNEKERLKHREKEVVVDRMMSGIRRSPTDTKNLLYEAVNQIEEIEDKYDENTFSLETVIHFVEGQKTYEESLTGEFSGFNLSESGLKGLGDQLNGNWREDVFMCFGGSANAGKCQAFDSKVLLANGAYKTIENVVRDKSASVATMAPDHKLIPGKVIDWIDSGILECYRVKTHDGIETKPSETHPYYTLDGWKQVKSLKVGDRIAISANYGNIWSIEKGKASKDDVNIVELLAGFLAEGSITVTSGFSNCNDELIEYFKKRVDAKYPNMTYRYSKNNTLYITDKNTKAKENRMIEFLRLYDIFGLDSHEKFIPNDVFMMPARAISKFLGMFWACDGWVHHNKDFSTIEVGISLCNLHMIKQIRSLLLRFGIRVRISESSSSYSGTEKCFARYTLSLRNIEDIRKFYNNIKIPLSYKQKKLLNIMNSNRKSKGGYSNSFPAELWRYIRKATKNRGLTFSDLCQLVSPDHCYHGYDKTKDRYKILAGWRPRKNQRIQRRMLKSIGYILQDKFLISLAEGDIYFDKITEIESIGKKQCYDLEIEGTHNFIANDIIVHNTSLCCQLAYEIATGKDNDACVIYHSIDDSREQILPRFVAQAYGHHDLSMNQIRNPNYYLKHDEQGKTILQRRQMGYRELIKLVKDGRIVIKDVNDGTSFAFGESLIKYYQKKYPDRNIVYMLDNLHKTPDFANMEPRMRYKTLSNKMKETATRNHVCIAATVEYTKLPPGTIPTNYNIAETRAIIFDTNFIGHLYNDVHETGGHAVCFHEHADQILPRIRLGIGKNKITEFKDRVFLDFFPSSGLFRYIPTDTAEDDMRQQTRGGSNKKKARNNSKFKNNDGDQPEMPN